MVFLLVIGQGKAFPFPGRGVPGKRIRLPCEECTVWIVLKGVSSIPGGLLCCG
jgi:hypothetical protein